MQRGVFRFLARLSYPKLHGQFLVVFVAHLGELLRLFKQVGGVVRIHLLEGIEPHLALEEVLELAPVLLL